jgi:ferredoxin
VDEEVAVEVQGGRITADRQACMGAGLCSYVVPKYVDVVDGVVEVLRHDVSADDVALVEEAVEGCPMQALAFAPSTDHG